MFVAWHAKEHQSGMFEAAVPSLRMGKGGSILLSCNGGGSIGLDREGRENRDAGCAP